MLPDVKFNRNPTFLANFAAFGQSFLANFAAFWCWRQYLANLQMGAENSNNNKQPVPTMLSTTAKSRI
jgi:hypothetical protein